MKGKNIESLSEWRPSVHEVVAECFAEINDKPCWNPKQGHGSFITIEFGEPHLIVRATASPTDKHPERRIATVRGDWHLWIYCCGWIIVQDGQQLAHSESSRETIGFALARLSGQILIRVSVVPETGASVFEFDLGGRLETSRQIEPPNEEPDENWMLFDNKENVLSYRADGKYAYHHKDEITNEWFS
jgi:hypothetical protein